MPVLCARAIRSALAVASPENTTEPSRSASHPPLTLRRADALAAGALDRMATTQMPPCEREEILRQMLLTEREAASLLMFSNATQDWRDLLPGISVPALVIGGGASIFSAASIENLAAAIPGAVVRIIPAADGGSHLSFLENPSAVNGAIRAFLDPRMS